MYDSSKYVDLILFMGQSNMAGRAAPAPGMPDSPAPSVAKGCGFEIHAAGEPARLDDAKEPFGAAENDPEGINEPGRKTGSPVAAFINAYYAATGVPVAGVSASKGGSLIAEWQPGTPYLNDALRRLKRAEKLLEESRIGIRHRYVAWCQGESDGKAGTPPEEWTAAFLRMLTALCAAGVEHCFLIRIGHFNKEAAPGAAPQDYKAIIEAQDLVARRDPRVTMCSTGFTAMRDAGQMHDAYHYTQHAYNEIGTEAGANAARYVNGAEYGTPFPMKRVPEPEIPGAVFRADDYPDIASAVRAAGEAGGGTVEVAAGRHATGPIRLYSRVRLRLALGAVLAFDTEKSRYLPPVFTRWEGTECMNYRPLIYAIDAEDVELSGDGSLVGGGQAWWNWKKKQGNAANELYDMAARGVPPRERIFGTEEAALRPSFVQFFRCRRVKVEGVALIDGPQWTLHPVYCRDVTIRRVRIHTTGPNTDGLNPDSCRNVLVEDCAFCTGDDCLAVNSGLNEDGWRVGAPCENVVVRRCTMTGGHGGVVIGSAISGGVRNVCAYDCDISGTMQGLRLKSMRGRGGTVSGVWFRDIRIRDVSDEAIQINMFYKSSTVMPKTTMPSVFENIHFSDIKGRGARVAVELKGLPERHLKDITFENVDLAARETLSFSDTDDLKMNNVMLRKENPA